MLNDKHEGFIGVIGKVNSINIDLKFKAGDTFQKEFFFIYKK